MALARFAQCLFALAPAFSGASEVFLQQTGRSRVGTRAFAGLRFSPQVSPQDPAARTLLALDTDHDGRIDPDEIAAFARSQGLDAEAATQEFASIDEDADGVLSAEEIQRALGDSAAETPAGIKQVVAEPPAAAAVLSYDGDVERVAPDAEASVTAPKSELLSEEQRTSVRMAAEKVAEDLALQEKEEGEARELDRKAAKVRADADALAKSTVQDALSVGAKGAHAEAKKLMAKISKLEDEAQKAEVRAAALRAKAKFELEQGRELMAAADEALKFTTSSRI